MKSISALALPLAAVLACHATLSGQYLPIGWRVAKFDNPGKTGAKVLNAIVHYPTKKGGKKTRNAPLAKSTKPFPVIVFLHGFGMSGGTMVSIGQHFAERGYVCVLTNTTRLKRGDQAINASAFFAALRAENRKENAFFAGSLDMARVGISGHSMGGGNTMRVLGNGNPGYKAGFCFAPWTTPGAGEGNYVEKYASKVDVPLAIVHGVNDRVLPWKANAVRLFDAVKKGKTFKALWVLDKSATHVNVAVPSLLQRKRDKTFLLCARIATAFFDRFLKGQQDAMKTVLDAEQKPAGVQALHTNK